MILFQKNGAHGRDFHSVLLSPYLSLGHLESHVSHLHSEFFITGQSTDIKGLALAFLDEIPRIVPKVQSYSFQRALWCQPHEFSCTIHSYGLCNCKHQISFNVPVAPAQGLASGAAIGLSKQVSNPPSPATQGVDAKELPWDEITGKFDFHLCEAASDPLWRPNSGGKFWTYCKECGNWLKEFTGKRDDDLPF